MPNISQNSCPSLVPRIFMISSYFQMQNFPSSPSLSASSADKKAPIETALEVLKKAYESKDLEAIKPALDTINEAWKEASEGPAD